jgi:hypothetical protein
MPEVWETLVAKAQIRQPALKACRNNVPFLAGWRKLSGVTLHRRAYA